MGVASMCGCKEVHVYRFPQYPTPLVSVLLFFDLFVIKFYVLNNFFAQYKHTYGRL